MDYSKTLKNFIESNNFLQAIDEFKLEKENILNLAQTNPNILCSNNSFMFVYFEQNACFLALSLNYLCKAQDAEYLKSFQRLSLNTAPIGQFKKCLINQAGTYVLLVYDKSLTCVELPSKWGKYDQYGNGKQNMICKSINFNFHKNVDIIDAIWHTKTDDDWIVSLTGDHNLKFFKVSAPNNFVKEYHFSNVGFLSREFSNKNHGLISLEMGTKFEYNDKLAYPIYVLKSNSQIECVIEYESRNFENIGPLIMKPIETEETPIVSFLCLSGQPNCLVTLASNGIINHCILIVNSKNIELETNLNEDEEINEDAVLYVYETINAFENSTNLTSVKLIKDPSTASRYFVTHSDGLHSVNLKWLENLRISFEDENLNEFDEAKVCEVTNLISTNPFHETESVNFLIGLTIIYDFGKTNRTLICLDNQAKFLSLNVELTSSVKRLEKLSDKKETENEEQDDLFTNYISSLLNRETNMPVLRATLKNELDNVQLKQASSNMVNLIRNEYIEKQKKVVLEFQKKCKLLKQQEKFQSDTIKDINLQQDSLKSKKDILKQSYTKAEDRLKYLEQRLENVFNRIFERQCIPLNENERKIYMELKGVRHNLREVDEQIISQKQLFGPKEQDKRENSYMQYDEQELGQIKGLLKNESDKIKDLIQKVELIKTTVSKQ